MESNNDLFSNISIRRAISPVNAGSGDSAIVSQIINMEGVDAVVFAIATGSLSDANATFAVLIEESDASNMAAATAVADADLLGTEALAGFAFGDDDETRKIGYKGTKQYVTCTITPSGNTGDVFVSAVAIVRPRLKPASNP